MGIPPRTHLGCSEFSRVNILPVKYRADQIKLNHMFNIVHGSAPEYLKQSINLSPNLQYITNKHLFKKNVKAYLWEKLLAVDQDDYIYF